MSGEREVMMGQREKVEEVKGSGEKEKGRDIRGDNRKKI